MHIRTYHRRACRMRPAEPRSDRDRSAATHGGRPPGPASNGPARPLPAAAPARGAPPLLPGEGQAGGSGSFSLPPGVPEPAPPSPPPPAPACRQHVSCRRRLPQVTPALPLPPLPFLYGPPALEGGKEPKPGSPPPAGEGAAAAAQPELLPARALHALLHRSRRQPARPGAAAARRGPVAASAAALRVVDRRGAARRPPPPAPGARRLGTSGPLPAPLPLRPAALAGAGPPGATR